MIETNYLDKNAIYSEAAGHMRPELLARGLKRLKKPLHLLITHLEPGNEEAIMAEIEAIAGEFMPQQLRRGQIFSL